MHACAVLYKSLVCRFEKEHLLLLNTTQQTVRRLPPPIPELQGILKLSINSFAVSSKDLT